MSDTCAACSRTFTSTSVPKTSYRHSNKYHTTCTKLSQVRNEDNLLLKMCTECIAESNPSVSAQSRSASISSINSSGDMRIFCPNTPRASTPTIGSILGEVWEVIKLKLHKLDNLHNIDSIATSLEKISKRFVAAEDRLDVVKSRLTEAESMQILVSILIVMLLLKNLHSILMILN